MATLNYVQRAVLLFLKSKTSIAPTTNKTCVKLPLSKRPKIGFQDQLSLNAGQKYLISYHLSLRSLFCLFLNGSFTQVLLYLVSCAIINTCSTLHYIWNMTQLTCISLDMMLSNKRITKALIRLHRCTGWSAPLLFANP